MKNSLEKKITAKLKQLDVAEATQGLCMQVYKSGQKKVDLRLGQTYRYYDLASLTKIIFTVPALMQAIESPNYGHKKLLQDPVSKHLPWWPHKGVRVQDVLSHSAGLPWWAPYYKSLNLKLPFAERREKLRRMLMRTERSVGRSVKAVYSDVDFILLGFLIENIYGQPLIDVWQDLGWREHTPSLHFNLNNKPKYKREHYAPTERCPWRQKVLRGEVHDDNTWSFGGVSSHAGLFGAIEDVSQYGLLLRRSLVSSQAGRTARNSNQLCSSDLAKKFCRRATPRVKGDWALGFMLPTRGQASCGRHFHATSVGHTGFTGTSLWFDPKADILITILSNRVYPTRENKKFISLRPQLHDIVRELL